MDPSTFRAHRTWWFAGAVIALAIFVVLAALAGQQPGTQGDALAPGESQMLRAQVIEILEEGMLSLIHI